MENVTLNELSFVCPEGFRVLDEEEIKKYNFPNERPGCVLTNLDKHITVSLAFHRVNFLAYLLVNVRELAAKMAEYITSADQEYEHKQGGFFNATVGGEKAAGFDYSYKVQDIDMDARVYVVKHHHVIYYMYFYFRSELCKESLEEIKEIVSSMNWTR